MADASPGLLLDSMKAIEHELELMLNSWADAEDELVRRTSQVERLAAPKRLKLKKHPPFDKPTREDLDALLVEWLWEEHGELMEAQLNAEALIAAFKAKYKTADRALSSKQSRLNAELAFEGRKR